MGDLLLALDQGTTSSRAVVFTPDARPLAIAQYEHPQSFPREGWVEHDPEAIWSSQIEAARDALTACGASARDCAAIGIANQRETVLIWERATGRPIAPAIVWQDRRTAATCKRLADLGQECIVQERTGLLLDPYFSASKIAWLLDAVPGARARAEAGALAFGTVDTFLLWRLTGGALHATDVTNASRTLLMDIERLCWDEAMLELFGIPRPILPEILPTAHRYGTATEDLFGSTVPIAALVGDQQSAAFGQACFAPGMAKNTYGTGAFLLLNAGEARPRSSSRLLGTPAYRLGEAAPRYALEGSVFVAGAAVQWLRDGLGIIQTAAEVEALAASVPDTGGVTFVPAFVGLGAPHWRPDVRGMISGLTRGATRAHLARAALEAACMQTVGVLEAMAADASRPIETLRADGGMAANDLLLQMQADLAGIPVHRPQVTETTALGAAWLAGLGAGLYRDTAELAPLWKPDRVFEPTITSDERIGIRDRWRRALGSIGAESEAP